MSVTISGSGQIVKQVINATYAVSTSTTSTSFVTTGLTATITPTNSANKILILVTDSAQNSSSANGAVYTLFRGTVSGTNLGNATEGFGNFAAGSGSTIAPYSVIYLDSPSTTSATTYTFAMLARSGTTAYAQNGSATASITLMEIAYA
jgi:hypothetical protein